jgi:SAM-dependent methyltransferase
MASDRATGEHPIVIERDRELVRNAFLPLGTRVLALRATDGASFRELDARTERALLSPPGEPLPYEDASFDHVLMRDVFHRGDAPLHALAEVQRVLQPGGRLDVLEPCGQNPLVGNSRGTPRELERLIARRFVLTETSRHQAMPLHRALFGAGRGAVRNASGRVERAVTTAERVLELLVPRPFWAFVHLRARRI